MVTAHLTVCYFLRDCNTQKWVNQKSRAHNGSLTGPGKCGLCILRHIEQRQSLEVPGGGSSWKWWLCIRLVCSASPDWNLRLWKGSYRCTEPPSMTPVELSQMTRWGKTRLCSTGQWATSSIKRRTFPAPSVCIWEILHWKMLTRQKNKMSSSM